MIADKLDPAGRPSDPVPNSTTAHRHERMPAMMLTDRLLTTVGLGVAGWSRCGERGDRGWWF
jgi:hypothetical protein